MRGLRRDAKAELIARVPLFAGLSRRERAQVASIADELDLPAGKTLIREGERGRELFVLVDGEVEVTRGGRRRRTLAAGDFFGEIALVSRVPRTATVRTTTPVRVLVVSQRNFARLLRLSPGIATKVLEAVAERLRDEL